MRHRVKKNSLNMANDHRVLLVKNLVTDLIENGKLKTTEKRAKIIQSELEKLITYAKTHNQLMIIRRLKQVILTESASKKFLEEIFPKYKEQKSGFVRIINAGYRAGDAAILCYIE